MQTFQNTMNDLDRDQSEFILENNPLFVLFF